MDQTQICEAITAEFPYRPTEDQSELIGRLAGFISGSNPTPLFVLKGYAGTGKTTIVSSLVKLLPRLQMDSVLLAPTGRAAKVLASYSGKTALTIHKKIYRLQTAADGTLGVGLQLNKHRDTVFIVDEASMIPGNRIAANDSLFGGSNLLDDLFRFVYNHKNCRMILIGDTAQLPPVQSPESPALNTGFLQDRYGLKAAGHELTEVVRQSKHSGILYNATLLRRQLLTGQAGFPGFRTKDFPDMIRTRGAEAADEVDNAFVSQGKEEALMICRSNNRARLYNQHIRQRVLFMEEEVNAGDLLMVVRNNYFWLPQNSEAGFIANGDIMELKRIRRLENLHGFRFADVTARLTDYPDEADVEAKILLDTLDTNTPALPPADRKRLYEAVSADYQDIPNKRSRLAKIKKDPYLNALQVKFAYAMTCHKAQGGQWKHVFIEMGYLPGNEPDTGYLRWLYTALTRATSKVYLLNFSEEFFIDND